MSIRRVTSEHSLKRSTWNIAGGQQEQKEENFSGPEAAVCLECSRSHKENDVAQGNCVREETSKR